jgi:hypothetical protein
MGYTPVPAQSVGGTITAAYANTYIRDNFAAGVPDIFTTKGDIAVASGADAAARLGAGSDYQVLESLAAATLGTQYGSGVRALATGGPLAIATASLTKVTGLAASSDPYAMVDTLNNRITIPVGFPTRLYYILANCYWTAGGTVNKYRFITIRVSGGTYYCGQASVGDDATNSIYLTTCSIISLAAADYIEAYVQQNSGGNLNVNEVKLGLFMIR